MTQRSDSFKVLIAGGGVAALEAALALRDLLGQRAGITLLAPEEEFVYRPMVVREPFGLSQARRYSLERIARDIGAELVSDRLRSVEPQDQTVHTEGGATLPYEALLLGLGARMQPRFAHATTLDDRELDKQLHGLIQDVEGGYVSSLVFVVPDPMPWPLPGYELALMTAARARDMGVTLSVTVVTPESSPLAVFGTAVTEAVQALLEEGGVEVITSAHCDVPSPGQVAVRPGDRTLRADRIVALPQLVGPDMPGVPGDGADGFIPVDDRCRVRGLERVFAAGDATSFPIKHGGIAAQQADTAAQGIAELAGADVTAAPFRPVIQGVLLGGPQPLYLSAHVTGGHGSSSSVSDKPPEGQEAKLQARYLAPYLAERDRTMQSVG